MIERVRIRNFQSLRDTQIELGVLTVIVGLSDLGKSAFFRAIRSAVEAAPGSDFITYGQKAAVVDIWLDGRHLTWEKGERKNQFTLDDTTWEKVGRNVPPDLEEFLCLGEVSFDKDLKLNLNFADQEDPPFLIPFPGGLTSSGVAKILGDLTNLNVLYRAQATADLKRKQSDSLVKIRTSDLVGIDSSLLAYSDLNSRIQELAEIEELWEELTDLSSKVRLLQTVKSERESLRFRHTALTQELELIGPDFVEDYEELENQFKELDRLRSYKASLDEFALNLTLLSSAKDDDLAAEHEAEDELKTLLETMEICPLCDQPMDSSHYAELWKKEHDTYDILS